MDPKFELCDFQFKGQIPVDELCDYDLVMAGLVLEAVSSQAGEFGLSADELLTAVLVVLREYQFNYLINQPGLTRLLQFLTQSGLLEVGTRTREEQIELFGFTAPAVVQQIAFRLTDAGRAELVRMDQNHTTARLLESAKELRPGTRNGKKVRVKK